MASESAKVARMGLPFSPALAASSMPCDSRPRILRGARLVTVEGQRAEHVAVAADRERLDQALSGLVDNALRHGNGDILLAAREAGEFVEIHVTDDGPGIPLGFRERAFERFSRGDDARNRGGSGLGLSIVALIATAHGGSAGVGDAESGGADVWLSLPRASGLVRPRVRAFI